MCTFKGSLIVVLVMSFFVSILSAQTSAGSSRKVKVVKTTSTQPKQGKVAATNPTEPVVCADDEDEEICLLALQLERAEKRSPFVKSAAKIISDRKAAEAKAAAAKGKKSDKKSDKVAEVTEKERVEDRKDARHEMKEDNKVGRKIMMIDALGRNCFQEFDSWGRSESFCAGNNQVGGTYTNGGVYSQRPVSFGNPVGFRGNVASQSTQNQLVDSRPVSDEYLATQAGQGGQGLVDSRPTDRRDGIQGDNQAGQSPFVGRAAQRPTPAQADQNPPLPLTTREK